MGSWDFVVLGEKKDIAFSKFHTSLYRNLCKSSYLTVPSESLISVNPIPKLTDQNI